MLAVSVQYHGAPPWTLRKSGLTREEQLAGGQTGYIFALSLTFVFLVLAALYESWSVPFSVLLAVPLGAFGAIVALIILPKLPNNVYAGCRKLPLLRHRAAVSLLRRPGRRLKKPPDRGHSIT